MSIVLITHTVIFSKQEVSKGVQRVVAQERINVRETSGKIKLQQVKFCFKVFRLK